MGEPLWILAFDLVYPMPNQGLIRLRLTPCGATCGRPNWLAPISRTGVLIKSWTQHLQKRPTRWVSLFCKWRWARDSNPGSCYTQRFSRPPLSTTQPAHRKGRNYTWDSCCRKPNLLIFKIFIGCLHVGFTAAAVESATDYPGL